MAEDPGAPSFVRLARAYRRQGRRRAARDVVLAGLQQHPEHVDAHALLALLCVEDEDRERARDEWEIVLRLDPGNFDASRGLGFLALERGDLDAARRHLDIAARGRPDDPAVRQARQVLERREARAATAGTDPGPPDGGLPPGGESMGMEAPADEGPGEEDEAASLDPQRVFASLSGEGPFMGALLLDDQGLVLAGSMAQEGGEPELLVGMLGTAVAEARRTAELMKLGGWQGLLLDCEVAALHVAPVADAVLVMAARRNAPAGWVVRTAEQARSLARRFLEVAS